MLLALESGVISGEKLEDAIFYHFVKDEEVMLQATDISGAKKELLTFKIKHNRMLTDPRSEVP
ncbi:hypothetical protein BGZ76_004786, partial [Entomortierella beljakovae]